MIFWKEYCYSDQLILGKYILLVQSIPYDVLRQNLIQKKLISIDSNAKKDLLLKWHIHYQAIAWWLMLLVLGIYKPLLPDQSEVFINCYPEANFSIAKLKWALTLYQILPLDRKKFHSPAELWYMLELSDFWKWLEFTGMTGFPSLNKAGRILGKTEGLKADITALEDWKKDFEWVYSGKKDLDDLGSFTDDSYTPTLTEFLLGESLYWLKDAREDDTKLYSACLDFLNAKLQMQRFAGKKQHAETQSAFYLISPNEVFVTNKGIKTPRPSFTPKRGKGRPPLGSRIKKC